MYNNPLAYFISIRTYGTWLHGDARGSVDRVHNQFGTPMIGDNPARNRFEAAELDHPPLTFDRAQRDVVHGAMLGVCEYRHWRVHAINVLTEHVHSIITADPPPERVMNDLKAWATRRLIEAGLIERGRRVWSRHGSTIYLFTPTKLEEKRRYVLEQQ